MLKRVLILALTLPLSFALPAQNQGATITPNYKEADITTIIEAVSDVTGKNFIVSPLVRAPVTMISQSPLSPEAFYQAFLSILQVHGFVALPAGDVIKIVPDANARQYPGNDLNVNGREGPDEYVTQVVDLKYVSAAMLFPVLRPLSPTQGHMAAFAPSNSLIISDRASNVDRLLRIIRRIDKPGSDEFDVVQLANAAAGQIVTVVNQLYPPNPQEGANAAKMVADERTNSVIITGETTQRLRMKTLVTYLDTPVESGGGTEVRFLRYADAEKIADILKEQATASVAVAGGPPAPQTANRGSQFGSDVTILAEPETNALIITAPPKVMRQLLDVVAKLDIRRAQVLVEAIIVDVSLNKSAELGVNWAMFSNEDDTRIPAGGFLTPVGGASLIDLVRAVDDPSSANPALANGTTLGIGRIAQNGLSFAAMLRALRSDDNSNIISLPEIVTMDNQEAEFKAAREVPFITGSFTNTGGGGNNGAVNPFQTINREEVGTILKVTPQINEGNAVMLKIELESSDILPTSAVQGAVDLTTSKRTINTNVLIEDGGIVVLGGLISENYTRQESRVPFLGRIPLIGAAFKSRSGQNNRTNLMVFIRPKILRTGQQTAIETNAKYNYIREEQRKVGKPELLPILPGVDKPLLPELPESQRKNAETPPDTPPPPSGSEPVKTTPLPVEDPPGNATPPPPPTE